MPSKKKKKSKGRGKAAKKVDEQQKSLDTQMERLKIDKDEDSQTNVDEDALLEEAIKLAAAEKDELDAASAEKEEKELATACRHGLDIEVEEEYNIIRMFTETFMSEATAPPRGGDGNSAAIIKGALETVKEKFRLV